MKAPIFIDGDGGLLIFNTVEDAVNYIEPTDVENYEYNAAYDSEGRLLNLRLEESFVSRRRRSFLGGLIEITPSTPLISIESAESNPTHQEELKNLLIGFLMKTGVQEEILSKCTLEELIDKSMKFKT